MTNTKHIRPAARKLGRPRTGAIRRTTDGKRWQAIVTLADGSQKRLPRGGFPLGTSEAKAREHALYLQEKADALQPTEEPATPRGAQSAADRWVEAWLADREARGLTSVRENGSHWKHHLAPVLEVRHPRDWTRDDLRAVSTSLDSKVIAGELSPKSACNVWGTVTRMCDDAVSHKSEAIRCRDENPSRDVRGPDRGDTKAREFLYPAEFLKFVECHGVPLEWRRIVTIAVYTFVRLGELQKLRWSDVDLERGTIHVHRANDRRTGGTKATKGRRARRIPIHPALLPLLRAMSEGQPATGLVVQLPSERDMARGFRRYIEAAGIERSSLLQAEATSRRIVFHDLRGTGLTWHAVAGTDPLKIQQWAGHRNFATTQGYLATADAVGRDGFGAPFPSLPATLIGSTFRQDFLASAEILNDFSGADGTRTRGLRRDRPAL